MKKIQLSIPTPCHENWDAMKPEDKGRFCGSCQKTVIDFTDMSDRQMAEFFKKPVASMCGRFHNDQLDRAIAIPKKRIPWVKYFFTIAMPAFLASCKFAGRQATVGKMQATEQHTVGDSTGTSIPKSLPVMGMMLMPEMAQDSLPVMGKPALPKETAYTEGNVDVVQLLPTSCDAELLPPIPNDTVIKEGLPMDTVAVTGYTRTIKGEVVMGGVSAMKAEENKKQKAERSTEIPVEKFEAVAYPNPTRAGDQVTVSLTSTDGPKQVQFFSPAGALMKLQSSLFQNGKLTLTVPASAAAGTYFLRIVSKDGRSSTVKIVVVY